ncbi:MAG: hypothetical protein LH614_03865 [Pyrinomonadaceae bacterium]|nr:hypothetical protein [Pyrinomonadaceae bacterium]
MPTIVATIEATEGGLMFDNAAAASFGLTAGVPVVTMVGVWVALGSGYYQAREEARNENTVSGFSHGFVTAILGWRWEHVVVRFRRTHLKINSADAAMDSIRVNSYHSGIKSGYLAGTILPPEAKKAYISKIRNAGNIHGPKNWDADKDVARNQQISYVIELATTALRYQIIKP